jgi:hypothetical protein
VWRVVESSLIPSVLIIEFGNGVPELFSGGVESAGGVRFRVCYFNSCEGD